MAAPRDLSSTSLRRPVQRRQESLLQRGDASLPKRLAELVEIPADLNCCCLHFPGVGKSGFILRLLKLPGRLSRFAERLGA